MTQFQLVGKLLFARKLIGFYLLYIMNPSTLFFLYFPRPPLSDVRIELTYLVLKPMLHHKAYQIVLHTGFEPVTFGS